MIECFLLTGLLIPVLGFLWLFKSRKKTPGQAAYENTTQFDLHKQIWISLTPWNELDTWTREEWEKYANGYVEEKP